MILLLHHNPYHVSTLLQCSEIFHHQREFAVARDLLERALFSLGRSLHSSFQQQLAEGTARLSFRRPENRELFLCGWRYIKNLSQSGTWRTAEEFARLLLAMDPEGDPYEMSLLVDLLALKSGRPERLLELTEHAQLRSKYSDQPNMAFSSALAHLQLGHASTASEYLSKAITKFPWIPSMLYQELSVESDLPAKLWGQLPPDGNLRQQILAKLYVERTKDVWRQPENTAFLVDTAEAIHQLPRKPLLTGAAWEVSLSLGRHVVLTDVPAIATLLPAELKEWPTTAFDPIPPLDSIESYESTETVRPFPGGMQDEDPAAMMRVLREALPALTAEQMAEARRRLEGAGVNVDALLEMMAEEDGGATR